MSDYFVDGPKTLDNKLGIEDSETLHQVEKPIVYFRMVEILRQPLPEHFDFEYLKAVHHKLFSDIYAFAGKVRTVNIAKPGSAFCYAAYIDENQRQIFASLKDNHYLRGLPREEFIHKFAGLSADLNALHPFREGNGRTIRLFLRQLAQAAGYYVDYEGMDVNELMNADVAAFHGVLEPLEKLLAAHISPETAVQQSPDRIGVVTETDENLRR